MDEDKIIICRCEEITLGEIKQAIREGARDVTGIKRRTRAGMGLCQGRTCERLIQQILKKELKNIEKPMEDSKDRPPVRPVSFAILGGETDE
jgi:NAD(P)H-nitrite reductase large subunit